MVGFLTNALKFQEIAFKRKLECWIFPPHPPEYSWEIYFASRSNDPNVATAAGKSILKEMGFSAGANIPGTNSPFEGPFDNFPYPGGLCQAFTMEAAKKQCLKQTPWESRLQPTKSALEIYDDRGDPLYQWTPRCEQHFYTWIEDSDGPVVGSEEMTVQVRMVQRHNLVVGEGNNVEFHETPVAVKVPKA